MKVYDWSKESTYIYDWSNASTVYGQMEVYDVSNQSQWMFMINEKKAYDWSNWSIWQVKGKYTIVEMKVYDWSVESQFGATNIKIILDGNVACRRHRWTAKTWFL
jgi:hypothetical protein